MNMEQTGNLSLLSGNLINSNSDNISKDNESENFIKRNNEIQNKMNLVNFIKDLENKLNKEGNENLTFDEIYEKYYNNKFITKSNIKENIDNFCFRFGFLGIGLLFGIIHLIGVYLIKSVLNALINLIIESVKNYFYCKLKSRCNITISDDKPNVFDFINYYYKFTMNETIDFNLMLVSGALGILLLDWKGFRISLLILCPFVFGPLVWLLNFEFSFKDDKTFDYGIFKILNLIFIYILIYIGIGALALISQQILTESYLRYKNRALNKIDEQINKIRNLYLNEFSPNISLNLVKNIHSSERLIIKEKDRFKILNDLNDDDSLEKEEKNKIPKTISFTDLKKTKRLKDKKREMENNKFDYFFIICLMTIFGYLGKYLLNFGIDYILIKLSDGNEKYDKNKFFISVIIIYGVLLIITALIYSFYKYYYFEEPHREDEKKQIKKIKINKICGYIIYNEHRIKNSLNSKKCCRSCCKCCKLGCKNIQNCCEKTFCNVIKNFCCCCCQRRQETSRSCKSCKYEKNEYQKEEESFHYCFKEKGWCLWLDEFASNKTVEQIFPYVVLYFILHLTTCGFENHYEKIKQKYFSMKTWLPIFIITFILFFYYTLSFSRFISYFKAEETNKTDNKTDNDKNNSLNSSLYSKSENENSLIDDKNNFQINENNNESVDNSKNDSVIQTKISQVSLSSTKSNNEKDWISFLSYNILNGTLGILLFNSIFSTVFSIYFLLYRNEEERPLFFNDNLVLIPILMTKFHYFTLNYYCTYTSESTKKFELISSSTIISFYILLFNGVMTVLKAIIPDDNNNTFNYFNIFYIIQILFSIIPAFVVLIFIIGGLIYSTGIMDCLYNCNCQKCKENYFCPQFLFCLCSFICCFGGLCIKNTNNEEADYECCNTLYCFGFCDCNIYCAKNSVKCCRKDDNDNKNGISCCSCKNCRWAVNFFNYLNDFQMIKKNKMIFN